MARIAFLPHPQMGHINPTIKLARQLQQRGHQVTYLTIADLEPYITSQGLGFLPILTEAFPKGSLEKQARLRLSSGEVWDAILRKGVGPSINRSLREAHPELLVIDHLLRDCAWLVRRPGGTGTPCVLLATALDDFRLTVLGECRDPAGEVPVLFLCPREFEMPGARKRDGHHYVEASIDLERRETADFPWDRLDRERPLIFCTLGSHCEDYTESRAFFRSVIEAMEHKPDWQLLLALGNPLLDPGDLQPVPPNVLLVSWAPQLAILERASLMMTHGGLGTIKECIYFGVPMIVFPVAWDQPNNAARVVHHGLGVQGRIDDTAQDILRRIDQVTGDPSYGERAAAMSRVFREIEERNPCVEIVEGILSRA